MFVFSTLCLVSTFVLKNEVFVKDSLPDAIWPMNVFQAMARDHRNYYQDTPKQIRRKILTFKGIPEQYNAYLASKKEKMDQS